MLWDFPLIRAYFDAMATDYFCASIPVYAYGGTSSKVFHLRGQWEGIPLLDALSKLLRPQTRHRAIKKLSMQKGKCPGLTCHGHVAVASLCAITISDLV